MTQTITIYHSPDADDAFMFYGMMKAGIGYPGYDFRCDLCDIESLNKRALEGSLEVSAVSVHAYAYLKNRYAILSCGASMGGTDYGPCVVALTPCSLQDGRRRRIAIPGPYTSATLALRLFLADNGVEADLVPVHFDDIQRSILSGEVDCGVIIHEGQITHEREGFVLIQDLGKWWWEKHRLPLPLGVTVARRDLGRDAMNAAGTVIKQSILCSLDNRAQALEFALSFGRGITPAEADRFVSMYVNEWSVDLGDAGRRSIQLFLEQGVAHGIIPSLPEIEFVNLDSVVSYDSAAQPRN